MRRIVSAIRTWWCLQTHPLIVCFNAPGEPTEMFLYCVSCKRRSAGWRIGPPPLPPVPEVWRPSNRYYLYKLPKPAKVEGK